MHRYGDEEATQHNRREKKELIQLVTSYGLDHEKVIDFSQDLDCLIYRMMEQKRILL